MDTVLILENDDFLKTLYKEELEEEGYRILLVEDERKALEVIAENLPNIIITNYQITPTKSYITMLHEASDIKGIPVIIYTAYPRSLIDSTLGKATEYLVKSSHLDILKNKVREMLDYKNQIELI